MGANINIFNFVPSTDPVVFSEFTMLVKTDNAGTSADDQFTIPTTETGYNYDVDWGDGNTDTGITGDITHTFTGGVGTYTVKIKGDFPRIYFNDGGDKLKLLEIQSWGDISWKNMNRAFRGCSNMDVTATDTPNLYSCTDMTTMFSQCTSLIGNSSFNDWVISNITSLNTVFYRCFSFNQDLSNWDTSNVTNMNQLFYDTSFNQDISSWNTSNVTVMSSMFYRTPFNQDINGWDVSKVTTMSLMFRFSNFNQDISSWDVSSVTTMGNMFDNTPFNQNISNWNTSNVTTVSAMFSNASTFNQNLGNWNIFNFRFGFSLFSRSGMSTENYTDTLVEWANQTFTNGNIPLNFNMSNQINRIFDTSRSGGANFATAGDARNYLTSTAGWTISGDTVI